MASFFTRLTILPLKAAWMLKASEVCRILKTTADSCSKSLVPETGTRGDALMLTIVASDGTLLASSVQVDSSDFELCERTSAVASSIAVEYSAMERLWEGNFRSLVLATSRGFVRCIRISSGQEKGSIFLIASLSACMEEASSLGLLRAIDDRIQQDLIPSIVPIMELISSVHPTE